MNARLASLCLAALLLLSSAPRAVMGASPVRVYTAPLTLRAYDWRSALIPTSPDDPIYPYPRLDFDRVGGPFEITTTVVILESANTRLTIFENGRARLGVGPPLTHACHAIRIRVTSFSKLGRG